MAMAVALLLFSVSEGCEDEAHNKRRKTAAHEKYPVPLGDVGTAGVSIETDKCRCVCVCDVLPTFVSRECVRVM